MFAAKKHESLKTKVEKSSAQVNAKGGTAERVQTNPLWQQLATRVQAKLTVGAPDDPYEREADRVADQVMRMPVESSSTPALSFTSTATSTAQRKCPDCEEEDNLQRKPLANTFAPPRISALNGPVAARFPLSKQESVVQRQVIEDEEQMMQMKTAGGGSAVPAVTAGIEAGINSLKGRGQPLPESTRAFFEPRFGMDFSGVRVHTDLQAAETAQSVQAKAFTTGHNIVFGAGKYAPDSVQGRRLLGHELVHVVQQQDGGPGTVIDGKEALSPIASSDRSPAAPASSLPHGNVPITQHAQPSIQRDIDFTGTVAKLGVFNIKGQPVGTGLGAKEDVKITFSPDQQSPVTEAIDFVQTAKAPGSDQPGVWGQLHPKEKLKGETATKASSSIHQTQQGETLASVSQQHFGTADKAEKIFHENFGRLVWWSAQSDAQPDDRSTRPLPAGVLLRIPDAVQGGFMVDIRPDDVLPRSNRTDPNISPNYPAQGEMTMMPGGYFGRINGFKRADGSKHDASMTDLPGGGPNSGRFEFESAAFAQDIGLIYGAIKWGFMYSSSGITNESASLVPAVSDTFNAAMASFNRVYKNKHIVRQGETLNSIAILYYGSTDDAYRIYLLNRTNPALPAYDPTEVIAGGTELEVGLGPSVWDAAKSNKK